MRWGVWENSGSVLLFKKAGLDCDYPMRFKIEVLYTHGWDDAEWTEEVDGLTKPLRFETAGCAQAGPDEFFTDVKAAVDAGDMDNEENSRHYRIVEAT